MTGAVGPKNIGKCVQLAHIYIPPGAPLNKGTVPCPMVCPMPFPYSIKLSTLGFLGSCIIEQLPKLGKDHNVASQFLILNIKTSIF